MPDKTTLASGAPDELRIDVFNTNTPNLPEEPTLVDGPPGYRTEMPCIPVHKNLQMDLLWPMDPKVLTSSSQEWQFEISTNI